MWPTKKSQGAGKLIRQNSYWREVAVVILVLGLVQVALVDEDFRQPFYVLSGSILSAYFAVGRQSPPDQGH